MGFKNEVFRTLKDVIDRLCDTINLLTKDMVKSITHRSWIALCFKWLLVSINKVSNRNTNS